jgi:hypothetical protein
MQGLQADFGGTKQPSEAIQVSRPTATTQGSVAAGVLINNSRYHQSGKELSRNRVSANTLLAPQAKIFFYGQATTSPLLNAAPSTPRARERERGAANQVVVVLLRGSIYYPKSGAYYVRLSIYIIGYMPAANRCVVVDGGLHRGR